MVNNILALYQQKRQNLFYEKFPPKETNVKLAELPAGVNEEGTPVVRRSLAADKDISEGEVIYSERPLVSALYPELEGSHCNFCLKTITAENKVECPKCDLVAFCSEECRQSADTDYHQYLCSHNKSTEIKEADEAEEKNVALEFHENSKTSNTKYLETTASPESTAEISMLKQVLGPKVQGISEFLSDEIYLMLKGKMLYNAYGIPASASEQVEVRPSDEHVRSTDPNAKYIGAGLYKISTYIGQSDDNANVKLTFENDTLSVTALKDIKKDDELLASYSLPVPKKSN
ncbi:hypothetical protein G6F42_022914 [Rhizopus arrhizus]|nr:hypothetical protein G6F42_022914 [Rhizopus arrhizus]